LHSLNDNFKGRSKSKIIYEQKEIKADERLITAFERMETMLRIDFIDTEETYPMRNSVLRPDQAVESVYLEKDNDPETFHLGVFSGKKLISIGSFHQSRHPEFPQHFQYQLRKMATDPGFRKMNAGRQLIEFALEELRRRKVELMWCNARQVAVGFYEKLGLTTATDFFDVPGIGPHKLMYINLLS
jgi:ribosomal protein S18 acetylase RimI-like enzyme